VITRTHHQRITRSDRQRIARITRTVFFFSPQDSGAVLFLRTSAYPCCNKLAYSCSAAGDLNQIPARSRSRAAGLRYAVLGAVDNRRGVFDDKETYDIIGAGLEVHRVLGCGFHERVYHMPFSMELAARNIPFRS
jgi:hypothetical protein